MHIEQCEDEIMLEKYNGMKQSAQVGIFSSFLGHNIIQHFHYSLPFVLGHCVKEVVDTWHILVGWEIIHLVNTILKNITNVLTIASITYFTDFSTFVESPSKPTLKNTL